MFGKNTGLSAPKRKEEFWGFVHYNTEVVDADRNGVSPYNFCKIVTEEIRKIKENLLFCPKH